MVDFGSGAEAAASNMSKELDALAASVAVGDTDAANKIITYLREALMPSSGQEPRAKSIGGVQYRPTYMLDAVLLCDNLRSVHSEEPELLSTVAKQLLGLLNTSCSKSESEQFMS